MKIFNFWRDLSLVMALSSAVFATAETRMIVSYNSNAAPLSVTLLDGQKIICNADDATFSFKAAAGESLPGPIALKNVAAIKFSGAWSGISTPTAQSSLRLVENPVHENIILTGEIPAHAVVNVCDLSGRRVMNFIWDGAPVAAAQLEAGIYILSIDNIAIKFVKL